MSMFVREFQDLAPTQQQLRVVQAQKLDLEQALEGGTPKVLKVLAITK